MKILEPGAGIQNIGLWRHFCPKISEAFEERKRYARVQGETAAAKLLIPMVLQLVIVLIILIVPACISFYQT